MKVSVIIPTYSRATLLCEAIDSVLSQDIENTELIVIDDGSTDDTAIRAKAYGDRIRYYRHDNRGLGASRNRGIELATGEYIALLDDDDWWLPGKLKLQVDLLDSQPELSGTYSNFTIYRNKEDVTKGGISSWYDTPKDWSKVFEYCYSLSDLVANTEPATPDTRAYTGSLFGPSLEDYFVLPSTAVFRSSKIPADGLFPLHDPICGDWDFFARLSRNGPLCFVDFDLAVNRSHSDESRLTQTRMCRQMEFRVDFLERTYRSDEEFYKENRKHVDRVWFDRLFELCKLQLLENDPASARQTARKLRAVHTPSALKKYVIYAGAMLPGSARALRIARAMKRRLFARGQP